MKTWFESLGQDLHYGVRGLRKSPGFAAAAIVLLALGIGANTAIFSLVRAVVLRPLPFPDPDRLVLIWDDFSANRGPTRVEPSPADYVAWKEQSRSFSDLAAFYTNAYNLTGNGEPAKLAGVRTTANVFAVLGMQPILGRTLDAGDDRPDAAPVVVVSERLWRSRFGADPNLIGRTIALNGLSHTVVGVVPPDFQFPFKEAVVWVPARFTPQELAEPGNYFLDVLARLKPETSLAQAQAEMQPIARKLEQQYPATKNRLRISVTQLHEHLTREARPTMAMLLVAVGLVLLTACANLANLLLARGAARRKEIALRKVLGAGHARLARQLLTESAVLAGAGAALGVALSVATFSYLSRLLPPTLPSTSILRIDSSVLLFTAGIAALIVLAIGSAPALAAVHTGLEEALRSSSGRTTTASRRLRSLLVIAEISMTVVLLVAAGLLLRSYAKVLAVDPGFNAQHVLLAETVLPPSRYAALPERTRFCEGVLERVRALPGVTRAAYANYPPLMFKGGRALIAIEGRPAPRPEEFNRFIVSDRVVSAGYFATLDVPVRRGREFEARDTAGAPLAAIINEKLARLHFPDQDPIGQRIVIGNPTRNPWLTIVGVVGDMRQMGIDTAAEPEIYVAANQSTLNAPFFWPQQLVVRTTADPLALSAAVRQAVWAVDADEPVSRIRSMSELFDAELLNRNTQLTLIGALALLTLLIAAVGLYAVLSYSVAQQLREIGVRMALGARRMTVVLGVVRSAALLTALGVAIGLGAAFAGTRLLQSWLFEVGTTDPLTFAGSALLLGITGLVATVVPAFRGASIDPTVVLRIE
ncbi:MAG TPA: ABC transporter permease [Vicinamibacterales bacterium]|jgi:predicted permease